LKLAPSLEQFVDLVPSRGGIFQPRLLVVRFASLPSSTACQPGSGFGAGGWEFVFWVLRPERRAGRVFTTEARRPSRTADFLQSMGGRRLTSVRLAGGEDRPRRVQSDGLRCPVPTFRAINSLSASRHRCRTLTIDPKRHINVRRRRTSFGREAGSGPRNGARRASLWALRPGGIARAAGLARLDGVLGHDPGLPSAIASSRSMESSIRRCLFRKWGRFGNLHQIGASRSKI
jgi:hypothetical protein